MRGRWVPLALAAALCLAPACGSEQSRMERGAVVDREEAVPTTDSELGESAAERSQQETDEEQKASDERFDEADQP